MLYSLFSLITGLLGSLLLLRAYLWSLAISPRDPLVAFAWKLTDWLVNPVAYIVKPRGNWDWSTLASTFLVAVVEVIVMREVTGYPMTPLAYAVAPFAMVARWAIDLLIWGLIIYCVFSFIQSARYSGNMALLHTLVNPFLRPLRRFIPTIGRFDLTPIVLFIALNLALRFIVPLSMGMASL